MAPRQTQQTEGLIAGSELNHQPIPSNKKKTLKPSRLKTSHLKSETDLASK